MPGTTPIYLWRFQELGDPPHGANLGANLAADAEATVNGIDNRLAVVEGVTSADLFVRKAVATARASTTVLADDPELTVTVVAGTTYEFDLMLRYDGPQAADFKFVLLGPAGSVFTGLASGLHSTAAATSDDRVESIRTGSGSVIMGAFLFTGVHAHGNLKVDATGGAFKLQWAQNTSDAGATTVSDGSHLSLRKVG